MKKRIILIVFILVLFKLFYPKFNDFINYVNIKLVNVRSVLKQESNKIVKSASYQENIDKLIYENESLKIENNKYKILETENKQLSEQIDKLTSTLGVYESKLDQYEIAKVILTEDNYSKDYIYINKGKKDNIRLKMPVIYKNYLIGYINYIDDDFSQVELFTSIDSKIGVNIDGNLAILRGIGRNRYIINNYNVVIDNINDKIFHVMTSGLSEIYPKNLYIGSFRNLNNSNYEKYHTLEFKPNYNIQDLDYVGVYKNILSEIIQEKIQNR